MYFHLRCPAKNGDMRSFNQILLPPQNVPTPIFIDINACFIGHQAVVSSLVYNYFNRVTSLSFE